jgi:uncharacterized membrane protein YkgB
MNRFIKILANSRLLKGDIGYHLVRASMVIIFVLFVYQKWFENEAQTLIPFINQRVWREVYQSPATAPAEAAYTGHIGG